MREIVQLLIRKGLLNYKILFVRLFFVEDCKIHHRQINYTLKYSISKIWRKN
jgi:hypothetical protein